MTFVYWEGRIGREFAHALAARARDGVRVRVLLDAWGARPIETNAARADGSGRRASSAGSGRSTGFGPGQVNHRTHRKVMIVDEATGFTGGVGIADEWLGNAENESQWRDTHFRIRGPAVDGLRAAFLDNWVETDPELFDEYVDRFPDQPQPGAAVVQCVRGASETGDSDIYTLFRTLCELAQHRIRARDRLLRSRRRDGRAPRAAPSTRASRSTCSCPGPHADKRFVQLASEATYATLLDAGVKIWTFQPSMLHTKIMTVDGIVSNVGSANLNARSTQARRGDQHRRDRSRAHRDPRPPVRRRPRRAAFACSADAGNDRSLVQRSVETDGASRSSASSEPSRSRTAPAAGDRNARQASPNRQPTITSVGWCRPR